VAADPSTSHHSQKHHEHCTKLWEFTQSIRYAGCFILLFSVFSITHHYIIERGDVGPAQQLLKNPEKVAAISRVCDKLCYINK
jgi:hypothetical protein